MNNALKYFSLIVIFSGNMFAMELQKAASLRPSKKYDLAIVAPDAARFTRDHKKLVVGSGETQKIYVFDTADYTKPPFIIDSKGDTSPISVHPNNTEAAVGGAWPVHIWDINTGQNTSILPVGTESPSSIEYDNEGKLLLVGGYEKGVKVYDVKSNVIVRTLIDRASAYARWNPADNNQVATIAFSDDGAKQSIEFWRLDAPQTPQKVIVPEAPVNGIFNFNNAGTKIVCAGIDQYVVYGTTKGELLNYYKLNGKKSPNNNPVSINMKNENRQALSFAFLPDDSGFFAGLSEIELVCCKFDKNDDSFHFKPDIKGVGGFIWAMAVNPEDNTLAAGIWETTDPHDGTLQIWDIAAIEEKIKRKHAEPIPVNEPRRMLPVRPCHIQ